MNTNKIMATALFLSGIALGISISQLITAIVNHFSK